MHQPALLQPRLMFYLAQALIASTSRSNKLANRCCQADLLPPGDNGLQTLAEHADTARSSSIKTSTLMIVHNVSPIV